MEYVLSDEISQAIKAATITQRPLLLKGEPGTGKSLLAEHIAKTQNCKLYSWHIKSTSEAGEGLYYYDAVARLNDSRFSKIDGEKDVHNIENYIRYGALGNAFQSSEECVVLIDEIDKADIEFPNDLLLELDKMEFYVSETGKKIVATKRPLIIITSNNEKELPDAFLRRCVFHYISFPDENLMSQIIKVHHPDIAKDLLRKALETFYQLREDPELQKRPTTSELIDWIKILIHQSHNKWSNSDIPYLGSLLKNESDYNRH
ncbi:MoxR family ATPase [Bacteriovoracaceae bacterium]|nr:MoxR family ATPase [Bacteriovoracaceae bacterium]